MLGPRFPRPRKTYPAARSACCRSMGASRMPSGRRAATACMKTASGDSGSPIWSSGAPSAAWTSRGSG
eukprot:8083588-Lingulodinium_polyedra.AAC.1